MRRISLFARFFGYGLLGVQLIMSLGPLLMGAGHGEYNMVPGFANVFMAFLWVPIGGVLSALAVAINRRSNAKEWVVLLVSLIAGAAFFLGILAASFIGIPILVFVLPPVLHLAASWSLRLFSKPGHKTHS